MGLTPYLFFEGRAEEAAAFYADAVGARVEMVMRFKESPDPVPFPNIPGDKIMHMALRLGESSLFASDGMCSGKPRFDGISLAFQAESDASADAAFAALAKGGEVRMPIGKTFFAQRFGMVRDKFGVSWMVMSGSEGSR